jgi:putative spermidine/putrescine transport system permease protein
MRPGGRRRALAATARALSLVPAALVLLLYAGAVLGMVRASLGVTVVSGWSAASGAAYRDLLADPLFREAVLFTLWLAAAATAISAVLALALAAALRGRGRLARGLAALPVPMPHLLAATVAVLWLGPGGIADRLLVALPVDVVRDPAGLGVILVYVWKETPFLALLVLAAWTEDVARREEVAAIHGAGRLQRMRWVVWPAVRAPLATGALVVAAFVLGSLEVPLVIGPNAPATLAEYARAVQTSGGLEGRALANAALVTTSLMAVAIAIPLARMLGRRG